VADGRQEADKKKRVYGVGEREDGSRLSNLWDAENRWLILVEMLTASYDYGL